MVEKVQSTPVAERKLFGTDGVRGVANVNPMTPEVVLRLGRAIAHYFSVGPRRPRILVGKDTRLSGYMFEGALETGIVSQGGDVLLTGPLPTPGIAFVATSMRADAGVVVSASHNPYEDNGIKIFGRDGFKLPDEKEAEIEALMASDFLDKNRPTGGELGHARKIEDAVGRYVVFLKGVYPKMFTLDGVKIVVDCANGAAYRVAPAVFSELGAEVIQLAVEPDGRNINAGCGALHPELMCKTVVEKGAQLGIALDGDADRVIVCDEKGRVVDGDVIMALCARRLLREGKLARQTLVATVMSNLGLEHAMEKMGGKLVRTGVGDRYVVEEMRRSGYNLGGEQSGHLVFLDHATTGDGVVAALQVLAIMAETEKPLSELSERVMTTFPQVLVNVKVKQRRPLEELESVTRKIAEVERALGRDGRVLVRWSGTELKCRVMVEGTDKAAVEQHARDIAGEIERLLA